MDHKQLMSYYRQHTIMLYLRWFNDYLTISKFAEHHEISEQQATRLINIGRVKYNRSITAQ